MVDTFSEKQSFSGADISIVFVLPQEFMVGSDKPIMLSSDVQTLTISSTASLMPVRTCGRSTPKAHTKGARTFAGTLVFTVLDKDPFQKLFAIDTLQGTAFSDANWHIDQMPPFDIVITAANEYGATGLQYIHDVVISHWGTTWSIDDIYSESTYTYIAKYVSPFVQNPFTESFLSNFRKLIKSNRTPDDITLEYLAMEGSAYAGSQYTEVNDIPLSHIIGSSFLKDLSAGSTWYMFEGTDPILSLMRSAIVRGISF